MDLEVIGLKGESISSSTDQDAKVEETKEEVQEEETAAEPAKEAAEEVLEELPSWAQTRLKKAEEEREHLSKAVSRLNKEKKTLTPEPEKEAEAEIDYPDWDENSKKFQEQTLSKVEKIAERKAQERIEKANEKAAIDRFVKENPTVDWNDIVSNYQPKHGRETVEDISKDLERAKVLARYERGELTNLEAEATKKGERKGKAEANLADLASVSKTTSKAGQSGSTLSQGAVELARRMRVDPKKLALEDDSSIATINI